MLHKIVRKMREFLPRQQVPLGALREEVARIGGEIDSIKAAIAEELVPDAERMATLLGARRCISCELIATPGGCGNGFCATTGGCWSFALDPDPWATPPPDAPMQQQWARIKVRGKPTGRPFVATTVMGLGELRAVVPGHSHLLRLDELQWGPRLDPPPLPEEAAQS